MDSAPETRRGMIVRRWSAAWALALLLPFLLSVAVPMTPAAAAPSTWEQAGGDIASLAAGDESGKAVAMDADGSRVAVGAPEHDGGRGAVRIYDWDGSSWVQVGNTIDGEAVGDQSGKAVSLSADGSRVAIGAILNDGNGSNSGHVRIYDWNGSAWVQVGSDIDGEAAGDEMGWAVSLSADGSRIAVGAAFNDGNGSNSGHVRIYDWDPDSGGTGAWVQKGDDIDGETASDRSGHRAAVSISGDGTRVAIGASHNGGNGVDSGHVRIYDWDPDSGGTGAWVQKGDDIDGEAAGDLSGRSVSLSSDGSRVAIGAVHNDGNGTNAGHVRIYDWDGASDDADGIDGWSKLGDDIDGEAAGDEMGLAVSLSADGSRIAVGAALNDGNGSNSGHVRIYDWNGSAWIQSGVDIDGEAADDVLGRAVSLSADGSRVAVGAPGNDGTEADSGLVRISELDDGTPAACSPATTSYTSGSTDYTVVTFDDVGTCDWTVPAGVTSVDVLAVGGGGGGGTWVGGGGGGGGVTFAPNVTVTPGGSIPVIVGAGGAGASKAPDSLTTGVNGAGSSFGSASPVTALGGGVGASWDIQAAGTGGSVASGGGGSQDSGTYAGGTGATSSGGSAGIFDQPHPAGGGGGAGGDGQDGTGLKHSSGAAGAGGVGAVSDITGTSTSYGGGGGGGVHGTWDPGPILVDQDTTPGAGGTGGGGDGGGPASNAADGEDGTDGLGGGGGGGATHEVMDSAGGDGGSGVVIVRYTLAMATCTPETTSYPSGSTLYTVLAFKDVGTCSWAIPSGVTTFDGLVVGGGGGGGSWHGGGGGAGGMRSSEGLTVPLDTSFTIQVGAGGAGAPELTAGSTAVRGASGGASRITGSSSGVLASVLGGGGGGSGTNAGTDGNDGADGGSGGGAQAALTHGGTVGSGRSGEGSDGGTGSGGGVSHGGVTAWVAGGGGGAGAAGGGAGEADGAVSAGDGGVGRTVPWLTASAATALGVGEVVGSDVYFAGGGAGAGYEGIPYEPPYTRGTGGLGGGGDGRLYDDGAGEDGAASTGGGGAGSSLSDGDETRAGGTGGSGVVVLRYGQPAPVTLTYDPRGGSGGPGDTTGAPGSSVTVSSTVPTRSGHTFTGWNTQSDGSGTAYAAGDPFTLPDSGTATLHAQWRIVEAESAPPAPADESTDPAEPSPPPAPTSSGPTTARPSPVAPETPGPEVPAEVTATQAPPEPSELAFERLVASVEPAPGETMTVTSDGFEPDEQVGIHLVTDEEVRAVASAVADAEGAVTAEFVIPSDSCGDLVLVVWAPASGVGFRQALNVTDCGLGEGSDVVQMEIASDGAVADGGEDGRLGWWAFALGLVVAAPVIASVPSAVNSRRRSGVADIA